MSEWRDIFRFSRAETFALAILMLMILIGGGVLLYQNSTRTLPPELFFQSAGATTRQSQVSPPTFQPNPEPSWSGKTDAPASSSRKPASPIRLQVNINTAPAESLVLLPRVGEVIGERIIALRDRLGRFDSIEQLVQVRGIGPKTLEMLRPYVTVGDAPSDAIESDSSDAHK